MDFHAYPGAAPDPERHPAGWEIDSSPDPSNNNSRIPETDSGDPGTETGSLETELRVHRIHGTVETGSQSVSRSLVAPHKARRC